MPSLKVISSLGFTTLTTTLSSIFSYFNSAVGATLSIQLTLAVIWPVLPAKSLNSKINSPFSLNA